MLQEPLLVVGAFYILFFTVIIYVRLDFSITKVRTYLISVITFSTTIPNMSLQNADILKVILFT